MSIAPGTYVGPYEILAPLGAGGMGEVYRARDPKLRRELAIKILPLHFATDAEQLARFEREARSASMLSHSSVVTIYEIGRFESRPFIAMELVDGETLRSLLARSQLPLKKALFIAIRVAEGLAVAHQRGIVHRDLKPENLMIGRDGSVKILDFGLAKLMDLDSGEGETTAKFARNRTAPGTILGTVGYMSPEQAGGDAAGFHSDQFAFGTILYEMFTGARPFQRGTTIETLSAIIRDEAPPVTQLNPRIPDKLRWIVERLLAKSPEDRYGSTRDLVRDLQHVLETFSESGVAPAPKKRPNYKMWGAGLGVVVALAILTWLGFDFRANQPRKNLPSEKYLAVLPFDNLGPAGSDQLFSHGVSETISARLSRVSGVTVLSPSAAGPMVSENRPVKMIAQQLGANLILRGAVHRVGNKMRISYSLLDREGIVLAGDSVGGSPDDIFGLEDELAEKIADTLQLQMGRLPTTSTGLAEPSQQDTYLRALGALQRYDDVRSVDEAISLLEGLRREAESSPLVHAALGRGYLYKYKLTRDGTWARKAFAACDRAAQLDPRSPEVHVTLGETYLASGRFTDAISEFKLALSSQPNSADATTGLAQAYEFSGSLDSAEDTIKRVVELRPQWWSGYNRLGSFYVRRGRLPEAEKMFQKVVELTPDNVRGYDNLGAVYVQTGRFEKALATFSKSIGLRPNSDGYSNQGFCYYLLARYGDAIQAHRKAIALTPKDYLLWVNLGDAYRWSSGMKEQADSAYAQAIALAQEELKLNPNDAYTKAMIALASAKTGQMETAQEQIDEALKLDPNHVEILYAAATVAALSDKYEEALTLLMRASEKGYSPFIMRLDPELAGLRRDPRFTRITGQTTAT